MYNIFGFTIADEPEFSSEIRDILGATPDVEVFDSYTMFNINGEMTKGVVVTLLKKPYSEGADLLSNYSTGIVPYDNPNIYYTIDEASAVVYGMDGRKYKNPELIQNILDVMENYEK